MKTYVSYCVVSSVDAPADVGRYDIVQANIAIVTHRVEHIDKALGMVTI